MVQEYGLYNGRKILGFRKDLRDLSPKEKTDYRLLDELGGLISGLEQYIIDHAIFEEPTDFQI